MNVTSLKHRPVVSLESGAKLGLVDDLLFATAPLRIAALRMTTDGQFTVLPWNVVTTIGPDALMVPNDAAAHSPLVESSLAALAGLTTLYALKVVDEGGTFIGTVKSVDIDPQSGAVTRVEAHTGGLLGLGGTTTTIGAAEIRSIGDTVLLTAVRPTEPEPDAATTI